MIIAILQLLTASSIPSTTNKVTFSTTNIRHNCHFITPDRWPIRGSCCTDDFLSFLWSRRLFVIVHDGFWRIPWTTLMNCFLHWRALKHFPHDATSYAVECLLDVHEIYGDIVIELFYFYGKCLILSSWASFSSELRLLCSRCSFNALYLSVLYYFGVNISWNAL